MIGLEQPQLGYSKNATEQCNETWKLFAETPSLGLNIRCLSLTNYRLEKQHMMPVEPKNQRKPMKRIMESAAVA